MILAREGHRRIRENSRWCCWVHINRVLLQQLINVMMDISHQTMMKRKLTLSESSSNWILNKTDVLIMNDENKQILKNPPRCFSACVADASPGLFGPRAVGGIRCSDSRTEDKSPSRPLTTQVQHTGTMWTHYKIHCICSVCSIFSSLMLLFKALKWFMAQADTVQRCQGRWVPVNYPGPVSEFYCTLTEVNSAVGKFVKLSPSFPITGQLYIWSW